MTVPLLKTLFKIIKTITIANFVIDGEAAVLVADSLLVLGFNKNLEHIDEEAGVNNGRVVGEHFFVNG